MFYNKRRSPLKESDTYLCINPKTKIGSNFVNLMKCWWANPSIHFAHIFFLHVVSGELYLY